MEFREIKRGNLTITGDIDQLPAGALVRLADSFEELFPQIWARFGEGEMPEIVYAIEGGYDGIAYTSGQKIGLNPRWLQKNPNDTDCMTHELIHAAQRYPKYRPGWLVEGIADYGRGVYGKYNVEAGWSLPETYAGGNLKDGYRTAAAFLLYLEKNEDPEIVDVCNRALQNESYTDALFEERTGKPLETLWEEYTKAGK